MRRGGRTRKPGGAVSGAIVLIVSIAVMIVGNDDIAPGPEARTATVKASSCVPVAGSMPDLARESTRLIVSVEPAAADQVELIHDSPESEGALRIYGCDAALRLVEDAVRGCGPVRFVRGRETPQRRVGEFDVAVVLLSVNEPFRPHGMRWRHLGDFVPVLLPGPTLAVSNPRTLIARRWLPLLDRCGPEAAKLCVGEVEPQGDLRRVISRWRREPGRAAVVSLAALRSVGLAGCLPTAVDGVIPTLSAFRCGLYPLGLQVYLLYREHDAKVQRLLEHLSTGDGRVLLRQVLN